MFKIKALAALSGGIDSTVAALMAIEEGYEVTGIYLGLYDGPASNRSCSTSDREAAVLAASELGIELLVVDLAEEFTNTIMDPYNRDISKGMTTNPCIDCNKEFKLKWLNSFAKNNDYEVIVTGHYADIIFNSPWNRFLLARNCTTSDQSYFLWKATHLEIAMLFFPLHDFSKADTRKYAKRSNISFHDKASSTDLCFKPKVTSEVIDVHYQNTPTELTVAKGSLTVGQRRGLPIDSPGNGPVYVNEITENYVNIVPQGQNLSDVIELTDLNIYMPQPNNTYHVQKSSQGPTLKARFHDMKLIFCEPTPIVAPGQSLVFYDIERNQILCGGAIAT